VQQIKLTKGYEATIDDADYASVSQYKWYADVGRWTTYAKSDQLPGRPRMHVFIMEPPQGYVVNHIDNNGLNNTRANLEIVLQAAHSRLSSLRSNKKGSKYRGVYKNKSGKYYAEIWVNYRKNYLGSFNTEEEAALAYNRAAEDLVGYGNFIPNKVPSS
jgi:hypothetical protein